MRTGVRWRAAAAAIALCGVFATAHAQEGGMTKSFDAAEKGNFNQAVEIWQKLAEKGDPQAQFNLGLMYHSGLGMAANEKEAVKWYIKAAEGGYSPAQVYLVVGYEEGWFGLPKDTNKAYYWRGLLKEEEK